MQGRGTLQQLLSYRGHFVDQMLTVVQEQERGLVLEEGNQVCMRRAGRYGESEGSRKRARDQRGARNSREVDEPNAIREVIEQLSGDGECDRALANPGRADDG